MPSSDHYPTYDGRIHSKTLLSTILPNYLENEAILELKLTAKGVK